ncbi:MAG: tetratricopeptide repeat protein [Deltaproteobacteria bacterium]|nr:tetratricopeptide repeat protein [Deltaproteobacteria bacterium]
MRPRLDAFGERWIAAERDACRAARIERTQTEPQLAQRTLCLHQARARLGAVVAELAAGGADAVERAIDPLALLPDLSACADLTSLGSRPPPPADPATRATLDTLIDELAADTAATLLRRPRDLAAAERLLERARTIGWAPVIAEAEYARAGVLHQLGHHTQARDAYRSAANAAVAAATDDLAGYAQADLAFTLASSGHFHEAEQEVAMAEAIRTRLGGDPGLGVRILGAKRLIAQGLGRPEAVLAISRETVELSRRAHDDPVSNAMNHLTLAAGHLATDQLVEAEREAELGLRKLEVVLGPDHPRLVEMLQMLGKARAHLAKLDDAQRDLDRALVIAEKWHGPESPLVANVLIDRVTISSQRGDDAKMRADSLRALAIMERTNPGSEDVAGLLLNLGVAAAKAGELDAAAEYATRSMRAFEALQNPNNPGLASVLLLRGYVARGQKRYADSISDLRRAVSLTETSDVVSSTVNPKIELSYTLVLDGKAREAVDLLVPLVAIPGVPPMTKAELHLALADALWGAGDKVRARKEAAASRDAWAALGEGFEGQRVQAEAWANQHR